MIAEIASFIVTLTASPQTTQRRCYSRQFLSFIFAKCVEFDSSNGAAVWFAVMQLWAFCMDLRNSFFFNLWYCGFTRPHFMAMTMTVTTTTTMTMVYLCIFYKNNIVFYRLELCSGKRRKYALGLGRFTCSLEYANPLVFSFVWLRFSTSVCVTGYTIN